MREERTGSCLLMAATLRSRNGSNARTLCYY